MPRFSKILFALTFLASVVPTAFAVNGIWTNTVSGGFWSAPTNWSGGTVADASGSTAFFTNDIPSDQTVRLDTARTLNALNFSDGNTGTAGNWTLDNNGNPANSLTLAGTSPTITVNALGSGKSVTISAVIAGTTGWSKVGSTALTLTGLNTYNAPTTIASSVPPLISPSIASAPSAAARARWGRPLRPQMDNSTWENLRRSFILAVMLPATGLSI